MPRELPLLPTTVVGSHALPSWLCLVGQHLEAFGPTDPRRFGPPNYDSHSLFDVVDRVQAPTGLGIVDEYRFPRVHADRPLRVAVPGPITLLMPLRRGGPCATEDSLLADLVAIVHRKVVRWPTRAAISSRSTSRTT